MEGKHLSLTREERDRILSQALWDLRLSPAEFLEIVEGKSKRSWPDRGFCVARLLESVNWFKIVRIINPKVLCGAWKNARQYVRVPEIREGMDFASRLLQ